MTTSSSGERDSASVCRYAAAPRIDVTTACASPSRLLVETVLIAQRTERRALALQLRHQRVGGLVFLLERGAAHRELQLHGVEAGAQAGRLSVQPVAHRRDEPVAVG